FSAAGLTNCHVRPTRTRPDLNLSRPRRQLLSGGAFGGIVANLFTRFHPWSSNRPPSPPGDAGPLPERVSPGRPRSRRLANRGIDDKTDEVSGRPTRNGPYGGRKKKSYARNPATTPNGMAQNPPIATTWTTGMTRTSAAPSTLRVCRKGSRIATGRAIPENCDDDSKCATPGRQQGMEALHKFRLPRQ